MTKKNIHGIPFHSDYFVFKGSDVLHQTQGEAIRSISSDTNFTNRTVELSNGEWIKHGNDDNTPNWLRKFYKDVGLNKRAISFKGNAIKGDGLIFETVDEIFSFNKKKDKYEYLSTGVTDKNKDAFVKQAKLWSQNIGLNAFHKKASQQLALYGSCFAKVLNYSNPSAQKQIQKIVAQSPIIARLGAEYDMFSDDVKAHFYSDNFGGLSSYAVKNKVITYQQYQQLTDNQRKRGGYIVSIPTLNKLNREPVESAYIADITPDRANYSTPDYECEEYSYYSDIVLEKAKYNHSDIKRNLGLTKVITIFRKKEDSDEKELARRKIENDNWKNKLRGSENQGMFIIDRVEPAVDKQGKPVKESSFLINEVPQNDTTSRYESLSKSANIILLTCHGIIDPRVAGIPNLNSSGLSSQMDFFVAAIEQMDKDIIKTYSDIECQFLTNMAQRDGLPVIVKRKKTLPLYRAMVSDLMKLVLDDDEIRDIYGFAPMGESQRENLAQRLLSQSKTTKNG